MKREPVIIYNIFPRLLGNVKKWIPHVDRAARMNFNWIFVNPFHYPGFSGSLYAPKDYFAFNPVFIEKRQNGFELLNKFCLACEKKGISAMMDLVINHSASDCVLVQEHPDWYKRESDGRLVHPFCVDPADTSKKTIWGDLAEIDNDPGASHRDELWRYWLEMIKTYVKAGFKGFRADAAYKVPSELWAYLISETQKDYPDILFFAETLGAEEKELKTVVKAGFDCVTNSSKWWDFQSDWCPRQYAQFRKYSPSVSFPETHDTPRLFDELNGNEQGQKMWYAFSAFFSAGVMMPLGFEWGFRKRVDVVKTMPDDFEEKNIDISDYVKKVNSVKKSYNVFMQESDMQIVTDNKDVFFAMIKTISGVKDEHALVVINKDLAHHQSCSLEGVKWFAGKKKIKTQVFPVKASLDKYKSDYEPGEVRVFVNK